MVLVVSMIIMYDMRGLSVSRIVDDNIMNNYGINCEYDYHLQYLRLSQTCDISWKMPFIQQYYFTLGI